MTDRRPAGPDALVQAVDEFLAAEAVMQPLPVLPKSGRSRPSRLSSPTAAPPDVDAFRSAYDQVLRQEAEKARAITVEAPSLLRRLIRPVILGVVTVGAGYVWLGDPAWLRPPAPPALAAPATPLAGQRQLVAVSLQIEDFRRTTGRLPRDLTELGLSIDHIRYTALPSQRYELRIGGGHLQVTYKGGGATEPELEQEEVP